MSRRSFLLAACLALAPGCSGQPKAAAPRPQAPTPVRPHAVFAPEGSSRGSHVRPGPAWAPVVFYDGIEGSSVLLSEVSREPFAERAPGAAPDDERHEMPISQARAERLREEALSLPFSSAVQALPDRSLATRAPAVESGFPSIDASQCCGAAATRIPPDPHLAAGPRHLIAATNVAFAIYDLAGNVLQPPTTFASLFAAPPAVPGCAAIVGHFDVNALYDARHDRFIIGIDDSGAQYCVAASAGPDPTAGWHRYGFATNVGDQFFDYPQGGIGPEALFIGSNMFDADFNFLGGRVWAVRLAELYAGPPATLTVVSQSLGIDGTPQPAHLHGFHQGTSPRSGPHYVLTDDVFDGVTQGVWSWEDPFDGGGGTLVKLGVVDLAAATGVTPGFPVDAPHAGTFNLLGPDWRVQAAEFRNGHLWTTSDIACNPGAGTVDCVRWARIDPATVTVVDAGVFGSDGEYRIFADVAANHCDDLAVGYSKTAAGQFPAVFATGRQAGDPPGTVQPEVAVKLGEAPYLCLNPPRRRWGDYSGLTVHPNGSDFYFLGEYSKDTAHPCRWATWASRLSYACRTPDSVGVHQPGSATFLLTTSTAEPDADIEFQFGAAHRQAIYGDWDGNGISEAGVFHPATSTFELNFEVTSGGAPDLSFAFGPSSPHPIAIAGDWDGDGTDTIGVYDPGTGIFRLRNSNSAGPPDHLFAILLAPRSGDPVAGDFDGDGRDGVALWDSHTALWFVRNTPTIGFPQRLILFGQRGDRFRPLAGDWNADGVDTVGQYDRVERRFALRNSNTSGHQADIRFQFGLPNAEPLVK